MKEKYLVTGVVLELRMSYYYTTVLQYTTHTSTILVTQEFLVFTLYEITKDIKKHEIHPSAQPHKLMVKPLGVQARLLRVVVAVKLVKVEVDVVVSQYNRNRPSLSGELFPTPDSSCSSLPSSSLCLKQYLTLELIS